MNHLPANAKPKYKTEEICLLPEFCGTGRMDYISQHAHVIRQFSSTSVNFYTGSSQPRAGEGPFCRVLLPGNKNKLLPSLAVFSHSFKCQSVSFITVLVQIKH